MGMNNKKVRVSEVISDTKGKVTFIIRDAQTNEIKRIKETDNLIVLVCKNMMAQRLGGGGNDCNITYGAVGTSSTAPALGDTTLGTELARKALTAISYSGAVVSTTTFFGSSEANGAIEEFGLFGEAATAAADSGTLINHALISETKTTSETLTVECSITIG